MSVGGRKEMRLVYGASPRVNLLPHEVADRKRAAAVRRSAVFGVVGAVVLVAGGYVFASWLSIQASVRYDDAQLETTMLLSKQQEYSALTDLSQQLVAATDAQEVGAMTEIDWKSFYARLVPTLPAGTSIDSFNIESGSPIAALAPTSVPGQVSHAAAVTLVASTPDLASAQSWIVALKNLPDYGGALVTTATREESRGTYTVNVLLLVTDSAYTGRFGPVVEDADTAPTTTEDEGGN